MYTTNIELLLEGLKEPLQVIHTIDPRDAEQCIEKWMPSIHKEIGVIEKAVPRLPPAEIRSGGWLRRKEVKVVPSKFVFIVRWTVEDCSDLFGVPGPPVATSSDAVRRARCANK